MSNAAANEYEIQVTTLTYGGDALGRLPDGRAVFVPFALPGERVRVRVLEERRGFAKAELLEVLTPASERIEPRCIHFGECGGCHYQHLPYPAQLAAKTAIVRDQLERIGGLKNPPVSAAVPSPNPYYYRNHIEMHLTRDGKLGYHKARSDEVFAARECHLPEAAINTVWPQLDFEAIPEIARVGLRQGMEEDIQLILESSSLEPPELSIEDLDLSAVFIDPAGPLVMAGSASVVIEVLGRPFQVSAGSFFQANTPVAEKMVQHLLDHLELKADMTVMDVYCGAGLFSAFLAPRVKRLIGIESSPEAAADFAVNLDEFDHVELYEAPAEDVLPALDVKAEVIVVDPPRTGLDRRVLDAILSIQPKVLAYVSCDPATLGRDIKRLVAGGYRLEQVTPFDQFPQTYHVECVALMSRTDR